MDDTTAGLRRYVHERYARLTGAKGTLIGAQMFETTRTIALASLSRDVFKQRCRRLLCEGFHGAAVAAKAEFPDFSPPGKNHLQKF